MTIARQFYAIVSTMLFKKTKYNVVFKAVSILLLQAFLVSNLAFAIEIPTNHTLAIASKLWQQEIQERFIAQELVEMREYYQEHDISPGTTEKDLKERERERREEAGLPIASQDFSPRNVHITTIAQQIVRIPEGLSELETTLEVDKIILSLTLEQQNELKAELVSYLNGANKRECYLAKICLKEIRLVALLHDVPSLDLSSYSHLPIREIPYQWAVHATKTKNISDILNYGFYNTLMRMTFFVTGEISVASSSDLTQFGPASARFTFSAPKALELLVGIPDKWKGPHYGLAENAKVDNLPPVLRKQIESVGDTQRKSWLLDAKKNGQLGHIPSLFIDVDATWLQNQKLLPEDYQRLVAGLKIIRQRQRLFRQYLKKEDLFKSSVELVASPGQLPSDFVADISSASEEGVAEPTPEPALEEGGKAPQTQSVSQIASLVKMLRPLFEYIERSVFRVDEKIKAELQELKKSLETYQQQEIELLKLKSEDETIPNYKKLIQLRFNACKAFFDKRGLFYTIRDACSMQSDPDFGLMEIDSKEFGIAVEDSIDFVVTVALALANKLAELEKNAHEPERLHAITFDDQIKLLNAPDMDKPLGFIAISTDSMKGYKKGTKQYQALNPLVIALRNYCDKKDINFACDDSETIRNTVLSWKETNKEARGIVLDSESSIDELIVMLNELDIDLNTVLLADVNNEKMGESSYIHLMEMLSLTLEFLRKEGRINEKAIPKYLGFERKGPGRIGFKPVSPIDHELKNTYRLQADELDKAA